MAFSDGAYKGLCIAVDRSWESYIWCGGGGLQRPFFSVGERIYSKENSVEDQVVLIWVFYVYGTDLWDHWCCWCLVPLYLSMSLSASLGSTTAWMWKINTNKT